MPEADLFLAEIPRFEGLLTPGLISLQPREKSLFLNFKLAVLVNNFFPAVFKAGGNDAVLGGNKIKM